MNRNKLVQIVAIGSLLLSPGAAYAQHADTRPSTTTTMHDDSAAMLKQDMRKLWTDHVVWTRDYIVAAVGDQPDAQAAAARLMKNQEDIGNAVAAFYGKDAGAKLTSLLKEHILIAVDLINAAKADDKAKVQAADSKWQANGEEIAAFLSQANPNWPKATLSDMMKKHLSTTTDEVMASCIKTGAA